MQQTTFRVEDALEMPKEMYYINLSDEERQALLAMKSKG
jgi:malate synthase